ncbi:SDR family NAD(P)-dependent oxidoreductase, partial [Kitasatospora sp. NPDC057512]|uniref:SDR family NAD(P)-dependent oxidoreductase n=1 Tax=Kitasatospora sp. NPDC057512 TaxID=3346154 RepID=UPI0036D0E971
MPPSAPPRAAGPGADPGPAGQTVVVTGAGRGIGLAITKAFLAAGCHVVAGSRTRTEALDAHVKQGADLTVVEVDLATPGGPAELIAEAAGLHGGIDVLVNNVGAVRPRVDGVLSVTDEGGRRPERDGRGLGLGPERQPPGRRPRHPGRPAAPARPEGRDEFRTAAPGTGHRQVA